MTSGDTQGAPGGTPPLLYLARRGLRFWKGAALLLVLGGVAAIIVAKNTPQPYRSDTVLIYDQIIPGDMQRFDPNQAGARLKDIVSSSERLRQIVQDFKLHPELTTQQAIEAVRKRLDFTVTPGSTFSVSFTSNSPQEAQAVLKRLTEGVIVAHNQQQARSMKETGAFISEQRKQIEATIAKREAELKDFLAANPSVATLKEAMPMGDDPGLILAQQELERLKMQQRTSAGSGGSRRTGQGRSLAELQKLRSMAEENLQKAQVVLDTELAEKTESHPDVPRARAAVQREQALVDRYQREIEKVAEATGAPTGDAEIAQSIRDTESRIRTMRSTVNERLKRMRDPKMLTLEVELQKLQQSVSEARDQLHRLDDQQVQSEVVQQMASKGELMLLKVHEPPSLPGSPVTNRRRRTAMAGLVLVGLLAAGYALARAMTSDRIYDRMDVAKLANATVLVAVPAIPAALRRNDV